jgi:lipoate-protein ligase B
MRLEIFDLGMVDFKKAWEFQREIFFKVKGNVFSSALILCQHYPVITLGRIAKRANILISEQELRLKGIDAYDIERGGDVTYHGPGQVTAYPIFNLNYFKKDISVFLRSLESIIIDLLGDFGITGLRYPGLTGVWVDNKKIASLGIAIRNWVTFHGLSINVKKNDLDNFRFIRPCGMDVEMTSMETVINRGIETESLKESLIRKFGDNFPGRM